MTTPATPPTTDDALDAIAARAFEGYVVRKDLVRRLTGQYPAPTYVIEFLLGRYCASTDPADIAEGLAIVERQLQNRTVRAGEEELFKSRAREQGAVKIIDVISARLDSNKRHVSPGKSADPARDWVSSPRVSTRVGLGAGQALGRGGAR